MKGFLLRPNNLEFLLRCAKHRLRLNQLPEGRERLLVEKQWRKNVLGQNRLVLKTIFGESFRGSDGRTLIALAGHRKKYKRRGVRFREIQRLVERGGSELNFVLYELHDEDKAKELKGFTTTQREIMIHELGNSVEHVVSWAEKFVHIRTPRTIERLRKRLVSLPRS